MSDLLYTPSNSSFTGYSIQFADVAPVTEPVTLAEAKEYARIDGSVEDTLITSLIKMARLQCEAFMGKAIIRKTVTIDSFGFPYQWQLPYGPLVSATDVTKVVTIDQNNVETPLNYQLNIGLFPKIAITSGHQSFKFKMVYTAGFTSVPEDIKLAIKMLVNTMYERREDIIVGTIVAETPLGVKALLMPYKTYNWFGA
jgi:uncharacterized phiE125 gp8 family phage protein